MGQSLHAVLFDMDGTLVDTEPHWIAAEHALVTQYGGTWSETDGLALVGNSLIKSAEYVRDVGGVPLEPAEIIERLLDVVIESARHEMPWRPGARELLAELGAAGIPCGMVTMSYTRLADTLVAQLPAGTFATVVTGDEVADGKPHPEAYLTAAARLGVEPQCCVAIEDSPTGVASAEAAGCAVVAVPHHVPISAAPGRTLLPTLLGVSVDDLRAIVAAPGAYSARESAG